MHVRNKSAEKMLTEAGGVLVTGCKGENLWEIIMGDECIQEESQVQTTYQNVTNSWHLSGSVS